MNAVFTIVAKNYLPLAKVLGDSIKRLHPDVPFYIYQADEIDGAIQDEGSVYSIIGASDLGITNFIDMAFKYNVTEFCTAVKPYCFEHLFSRGYKKIIYFDPDIYVFSSLEQVFQRLDSFSFVLTPHLTRPEIIYSGIFQEGGFLNNGTFNLGFIALSDLNPTFDFIQWWKERLKDKCYVDLVDGYFTDQKWIDFVPSLFSNFYVEKSPAYNIAIWNLHEREVTEKGGVFKTRYRNGKQNDWQDIVFIHFSNFSFGKSNHQEKFYPLALHRCRDFEIAAEFYRKKLQDSDFVAFQRKYKYGYHSFSNGVPILKFHRRFYRRLFDSGKKFVNPFNVGEKTFFMALKRKNLLYTNIEKITAKDTDEIGRKVKIINKVFTVLRRVMGTKRYMLFCRFATRYFRYENQIFLMPKSEIGSEIGFLNDVEYIDQNA